MSDGAALSQGGVVQPPPSRQIVEAASWRLVAEVIRRYPMRFTVVETHPGGGQYDCLTLLDRNEASLLDHIDLNRVGRIWFWPRAESYAERRWQSSWADVVAADDPRNLLDDLCSRAWLPAVKKVPPASRQAVAYRVIAAFLSHQLFGRTRWECRNGYADTADEGGGVCRDLFEPFPSAKRRALSRERDDVLGEPAYRFWFLVQDGIPYLAMEPQQGVAWDRDGHTTDLVKAYRANRRVWDAVYAAAGHLLP